MKRFIANTLIVIITLGGGAAAGTAESIARNPVSLGNLPLAFEATGGQTDPRVRFIAHAGANTFYFTPSQVVLALRHPAPAAKNNSNDFSIVAGSAPDNGTRLENVVRVNFRGATGKQPVSGANLLPGKVNYFVGPDPKKWRTDVSTYSRIVYQDLYPGIELSYEGRKGELKSTYRMDPGAAPSRLRWSYDGVDHVSVDAEGNLHLHLASAGGETLGELVEQAPAAWQE